MLMCFCLDILIAHMPGAAWVGLNDINVENQFVYTDGTPAVSGKARANYMAPKLVFLTYFLILCKSVKTFITNLKNLRLSFIIFYGVKILHMKILTVSSDLRIFSHGRHTSLTTGRIMKTVCTSQERLTMILENSMMTSAQPQGIISAKKV